ncbi:hypothetical protein N9L33_06385 [Nitrospinae bacterium]|nr:hypothetical protein [Nitrospinota bacterium]
MDDPCERWQGPNYPKGRYNECKERTKTDGYSDETHGLYDGPTGRKTQGIVN